MNAQMVGVLLKQFGFDPTAIQKQVTEYGKTVQETLQRIDASLQTIINKQNEHERLLFQLMKDKAEDDRLEEMIASLPAPQNGAQPQYGHTVAES